MTDKIKVRTECGVDVLADQAIVIALWTTHPVSDEVLDPKALGIRPETTEGHHSVFGSYEMREGEGLNAGLSLEQACKVWEHLGRAIAELHARQQAAQ